MCSTAGSISAGRMPTPPNERERALAQALLAPRSVAIVGQSDDLAKAAGRPLKLLRQAGYAGRVYPINPRRQTVLGERAWPSLAALPQAPEHAFIVTGADAAIAAVAEAGRLGVKVATVLADGFAEAGRAGAERVARLAAIAAQTGIRIVGPSSLGVVNLRERMPLTANAAFDEPALPMGHVFAASHSGSMIGALVSRGKARALAFAGLVSVGNEIDLSLGEICAAALDDADVHGYLLFLESLRHGGALRTFALAAAARAKPIVAYKLGRSAPARELARSHTGALAGDDDIADAFLADCGIARVDTLDGLIEALPLLARVGAAPRVEPRPARTVGVVTTTAGGATMVVDPLALRGIEIRPPSEATLARFAAQGLAVKPARLIDLTMAGTRYEAMKAALDIATTAPEFDLVLAVVGSSARFHPELAVKPIIDCAGARKPLAAYLVPDAPEALAQLGAARIPSFRTPEACADAIAAALKRAEARAGVARQRAAHERRRCLDALEAGKLIAELGIACAPAIAIDVASAEAPALPFPYPVAVKALAAELLHKSDIGCVVLGVRDRDGLRAAIEAVCARAGAHGVRLARVLVQPIMAGLGEALIGYRLDREAGPLVMVAAGGIFTEVYRDRSLRLAPVDLATARAMIAEVRGLLPLAGLRGQPAGDLDALAQAIVALSRLAVAPDPAVLEAEVNPLIVRPLGEGVLAVDALLTLAD
jgi:acyl-CoA synthetase (NDP forming)